MIKIALPKGRLGEKVLNLLSKCGYRCDNFDKNSRKLIFSDQSGEINYFWVKPSDVAAYVRLGAADIGVAGKDILEEDGADLYELADLKIGKCSMCVAAPAGFKDDTSVPLRVATKFVHTAEKYYGEAGRDIEIIKLNGSIELAPLLKISDVIVDIVETGTTLKENNLQVIDKIFEITKIDRWFLNKLKNLADFEAEIAGKILTREQYINGKKFGYPDSALEKLSGNKLITHRNAVFKMVDTCGAEFSAQTPYFYSTYDEKEHDEAKPFVKNSKKKRVIVIGSGPIRIGQGIEFDYSSVHCVWALKRMGYEVIIINNNPETVSTDFDTADRLYFEALTPEDVQNVIDIEKPYGVVITFGGQTAIKLCSYLDKKGIRILGTPADSVDLAEDRERFDELLEQFGIARPKGLTVMSKEDAVAAAEKLGYPVLLRPSYVIGGQNMTIAFTQNDSER